MYKEILINIDESENRVAVLEDGKLMELYISREDRLIGSIYKGKVANILPGMQAAFVDIGLERNAFLCIDDASAILGEDVPNDFKTMSIKDLVKLNQETMVQVTKESWGMKGARVTTHITLPGRYLVFLPMAQYVGISRRIEDETERERLRRIAEEIKGDNYGIIVRTAADGKTKEELEKDFKYLTKLWNRINKDSNKKKAPFLIHQELTLVSKIVRDLFTNEVDKLIIDSKSDYDKVLDLLDISSPELKKNVVLYTEQKNLFEKYNLEAEIEKALRRRVWLDSGGFLIIDKTEALTVIDVNTGKYVGKNSLSDTILKINLEAVPEIARQLRLRDIGGVIIIDFIDMESEEEKEQLLSYLQEELKKDHTKTHLVGMTELGLVQITRKRVNKDLDEYLRVSCPYCNGRGRIYSITSMRLKCEREIKKIATESNFETVILETHPKLAVEILGFEGEGIERLEKITGKKIILKANLDLHLEKIKIEGINEKHVNKYLPSIQIGENVNIDILDVFGINVTDGLGVYGKTLVDIKGAGNRVGENLSVYITSVSNNILTAVIKD